MENYEVMTPEKEAEVFGYIVNMIRGNFDRAQFAAAEQELREKGYLEDAGYTYEEMWNLLEACGLDMDAILDRVDDYGMGMSETVLCTLDILVDGNLFADDGETEPIVTSSPEAIVTPVPTATPTPEVTATPAPTAAPVPEATATPALTAIPVLEDGQSDGGMSDSDSGNNVGDVVDPDDATVRPNGDYVQGSNLAQDGTTDSELAEDGNSQADGQDATRGDNVSEIEGEDVALSDIDKIVTDVLGESGLAGDELIEIVEEEVPLVSDPVMSTNSANGGGLKKGWMLGLFFWLLLLIAILVGRAAYKKLESKAKEADE